MLFRLKPGLRTLESLTALVGKACWDGMELDLENQFADRAYQILASLVTPRGEEARAQ